MTKARAWFPISSREAMLTLPCPLSTFETPQIGRLDSAVLANGDLGISTSRQRRYTFNFKWRGDAEDARNIMDLVGGRYGEGPFWFINPMIGDANVLPKHWSMPRISASTRGSHALVPPQNKFNFADDGLKPNPYARVVSLSGRPGLPEVGMRVSLPNKLLLPDIFFSAGGVPFFVMPLEANVGLRLSAWGELVSGDSPICYATTNIGAIPLSPTTLALTGSGASVSIAPSSGDRWFYLWFSTPVNNQSAGTVATIGALELLLGVKGGSAPAAPQATDEFQPGRGQMPIMVSEDTVAMDNYTMVRGGDIALTVPMSEVYLPW